MRKCGCGVLGAAAVAALLSLGTPAEAVTYTFATPAGSSVGDGSVSATAVFTLGTDSLTLVLSDLLQDPNSAGQTISGITFAVSGAPGLASITSSSGPLTTINLDGTYTAPSGSSSLDHWAANSSMPGVTTLSGAKPNELIIGPDSAGGFVGAGRYGTSGGDGSIVKNFSPWVLGSATFNLSLAGTLPTSSIIGVTFQFGTTAGEGIVAGTCVGDCSPGHSLGEVPLPAAFPMFGAGLGALGLFVVWRRKRRRATELPSLV